MQWYGALLVESDWTEDELLGFYAARLSSDDDSVLSILHQTMPDMFRGQAPRFKGFSDDANSFQIRLFIASSVGCEDTLWEALLNMDYRGH